MVLLVIVSAFIFAYIARADKQQLQENLSKDISIKLSDVTIAEALEKIGQKAELKIVLSDEAIWKLPYGEATRLSVTLSGPLADSMTEMLNAFFMRYAVDEDEITIYPRPELEHILGRPTAKQLELLKAIYTKTIKVYYIDEVQRTINAAIEEDVLISPIDVQAQLNNFLLQLVGKEDLYYRRPVGTSGGKAVVVTTRTRKIEPNEPKEYNVPTPVTLVQLLNQVFIGRGSSDTRWYISGMDFPEQTPEVHVVSSDVFTGLRLNQKIDISYKDETLGKIFQDLASWAGVDLFVMPGSDLYANKLSANMQNVGIKQAILNIADMAGVVCSIRSDISYLELRGPGPVRPRSKGETETGGKAEREGYVGKISIPMDGGKYFIEFMLRESDLTEQLKKLREDKMKEIVGQLSQQEQLKEALRRASGNN